MQKNFIGKNIVRADGFGKVTGRAKYAGDYAMDGMLYAVVVRSERAHALIRSIDISAAEKEASVFTADDFIHNEIVDIINDRPVLAKEKVRYFGEPIAVVAAKTEAKARQMAALVKIEYEDLPVYTDPKEAEKEDAVSIHADSNLISVFENTKGDPEDGFAKSDFVLEGTFYTPYQEHAYMEPDAAFSYMDGDTLILISSSQNVFADKRMIVHSMGVPEDKVQVISATVGGGFGGKDGHTTQLFAAIVTKKTGLPCRCVFSRRESIATTFKRHSAEMKVKMGFSSEGRILAYELDSYVDTGAYIGYGLSVLTLLSEHAPGPYKIDNVRLHSKLVYTNKTPASAFRGFGAPQSSFAGETLISQAAARLGMDPVDIRIMNAIQTGDEGSIGQIITSSCGMKNALLRIKETDLWKERQKGRKQGIGYGVAAGHLSCGFGKGVPDSAEVRIEKKTDRYTVFVGLTDIGQGSIGSLAAIAADALETDIGHVDIVMADTNRTFDCGSTAASRSTFLGGNAIIDAAKKLKEKIKSGEADAQANSRVPFPESEMTKCIGSPHAMYTYIAQAVKVKVDEETGKISLLDAVAVTEAGTIINPMQFNGQIQGGMAQSMGLSLSENSDPNTNGIIENDSFSTYIIPTMADIPHIASHTVEAYEQTGPGGVKGAAEAPTVPTAGAINAAVYDATGIWHYALPMRPETNLVTGEENA